MPVDTSISAPVSIPVPPAQSALTEPAWVRAALIGGALLFLALFLLLPLVAVFVEALRRGFDAYWTALSEPDAIAAIKLTLIVAAISVPANLVFGVAASWCIAKFDFRGKNLLITLIDLPFSVSPVISGLIYVLLFGMSGLLGPYLREMGIQIIFAVPGLVPAFAPAEARPQGPACPVRWRALLHTERTELWQMQRFF